MKEVYAGSMQVIRLLQTSHHGKYYYFYVGTVFNTSSGLSNSCNYLLKDNMMYSRLPQNPGVPNHYVRCKL